jgi:hypothetical protein
MASVSDWARVIGTTIVQHLREEELSTFRKFKVYAMLEKAGNVLMNQSGRGFDWNIRYKNATVQGSSGDTPRVFSRQSLWKRLELPYKGFTTQDSIFRRELLENRGQQALVNVAGSMAARLQESLEQHLGYQVYADGNAVGQENNWHGLESFLGYDGTIQGDSSATLVANKRAANAADRFCYPTDNYAGLSTQLGAYGGGRLGTVGQWPETPVDPEFDFFSPVIVNWNSSGFSQNSTQSWRQNCVEAIRLGLHHARRNDTREAAIDLVILDRKLYIQYLATLDGKERINVESNKLAEVGFTDSVMQDGVTVTSEYACPADCGYGLSIGNMELRSLESTLLVGEGPFYDEELSSYRYACSVLANLRCRSPRNFFKLVKAV